MRARTVVIAVVVAAVLFPVEASAQRFRRGRRNNDLALGIGLAALTTGLLVNNTQSKRDRRAADRAAAEYYDPPRGYYVRSRPSGYRYPTSRVIETGSYYGRDRYGRPVVVREYVEQRPRVIREISPAYYYSY